MAMSTGMCSGRQPAMTPLMRSSGPWPPQAGVETLHHDRIGARRDAATMRSTARGVAGPAASRRSTPRDEERVEPLHAVQRVLPLHREPLRGLLQLRLAGERGPGERRVDLVECLRHHPVDAVGARVGERLRDDGQGKRGQAKDLRADVGVLDEVAGGECDGRRARFSTSIMSWTSHDVHDPQSPLLPITASHSAVIRSTSSGVACR